MACLVLPIPFSHGAGRWQTLKTKSGEAVDVVMSCSLRRDQSGKLVGFVCAGQNMDTLGGPQPQVTRQALARAAAIASAPT